MGKTKDIVIHAPGKDGWAPPPEGGGSPISDEEFLENVARNLARTHLPRVYRVEEHDFIMLFVAGGRSLLNHLDELRERQKDPKVRIFTSNKTHDFLIENGIIPWGQFIVDPKPKMVEYVQHPHKDVHYFLGLQCDPAVYDALEGYKILRAHVPAGIGGDDACLDSNMIHQSGQHYEPIFGGSMAPLRAMCLAEVLGFRTCEFYGFDSTIQEGQPPYAYDKERVEDIYEAECPDGKVFDTTVTLGSQARQYIKWKDRLDGLVKFIVHGDQLTAHLDRLHEAEKSKQSSECITSEYVKLNEKLHEENPHYGTSGVKYIGDVTRLVGAIQKKYGAATVLDYGCGKQTFADAVPYPVAGYDPAIPGLDASPEPADLVVCTDVLEHIEPGCLHSVLRDLKRVTKKLAYFAIHTGPAMKTLADGRNAHLIQKDLNWWLYKLRRYFHVHEYTERGNTILAVCQAKEVR